MQHHGYIYEGSQELLPVLVESARSEFGFERGNNPDLHVLSFEKFLIDDAHELARSAQLKSVSGRSLFILGLASINTHAQQALLKLFEEPQPGVTFVLLVPHGMLMATLRSRLLEYPHRIEGEDSPHAKEAKTFLKNPYKARSAQVATMLKDEENTKERVRGFVTALEEVLYKKLDSSKGAAAYRLALEDIHKVRDYLGDQSPSLKMLLEHLAATLPVV